MLLRAFWTSREMCPTGFQFNVAKWHNSACQSPFMLLPQGQTRHKPTLKGKRQADCHTQSSINPSTTVSGRETWGKAKKSRRNGHLAEVRGEEGRRVVAALWWTRRSGLWLDPNMSQPCVGECPMSGITASNACTSYQLKGQDTSWLPWWD